MRWEIFMGTEVRFFMLLIWQNIYQLALFQTPSLSNSQISFGNYKTWRAFLCKQLTCCLPAFKVWSISRHSDGAFGCCLPPCPRIFSCTLNIWYWIDPKFSYFGSSLTSTLHIPLTKQNKIAVSEARRLAALSIFFLPLLDIDN